MRIESLHLEGVGPFENTTIEFPKGKRDDLADVYLLVGENGCGKTTALHAIATLLAPWAAHPLGLERRLATSGCRLSLKGDTFELLAVHGKAHLSERERSFGQFEPRPGRLILLESDTKGLLDAWRDDLEPASAFGPHQHAWAAFGYAGQRSLQRVELHELKEAPARVLNGSLSFGFATKEDTLRLSNWVANQQFTALKAAAAGDSQLSAKYRESLTRIERAISGVIGTDFAFQSEVHSLNVRAKLKGTTVDLDLLPEGVKSVLSWIADLLMRMDGVRWAGDVPIHEREFLLLLDEIDVHLHPAWQRKLLPVVQKLFPKAQIIASTHSPFVVASLTDGAVIEMKLDEKGRSSAQAPQLAPLKLSVSATLKSVFGIESDFDLETENALRELQGASDRALGGDALARAEFDRLAESLVLRGEEVAQLVHYARRQLERRLPRPTGT